MGNVSVPTVLSGRSGGGRTATGSAASTTPSEVLELIAVERVRVAAAQAELDVLCLQYAELRCAALDADLGPVETRPRGAVKTQGFAAAELSLVLRCRTGDVSAMLARTRRVRASLPAVAEAARRGELDGGRVARIDRAARMAVEAHTLALLDDQVVGAAEERTLEQLSTWLDRFLARHEPQQLAERHRRGMQERRVTADQAMNGMAYITGEVSAVDGAAIDLRLSSLAQACGAADSRSMQQRRSDTFAGLLLGRIVVAQPGQPPPVTRLSDSPAFAFQISGSQGSASKSSGDQGNRDQVNRDQGNGDQSNGDQSNGHQGNGDQGNRDQGNGDQGNGDQGNGEGVSDGSSVATTTGDPDLTGQPNPAAVDLLEVEVIDPETGVFLGTTWKQVDGDGVVLDLPAEEHPPGPVGQISVIEQASGAPFTVGVVVTLEALIGASDTAAELWDRRASLPASAAREISTRPDTLFARLLTDPAGRLLDVTELGRFPSDKLGFAVRARSATCVFPTCETPASRCDLDHHEPVPRGPTTASNLGPLCRPHHKTKTFAWLTCRRVDDGYLWTTSTAGSYRCLDEPFPTEHRPEGTSVLESAAAGMRSPEAA